ncbi:hypothetical protein L209DRAFT_21157 [Thermothelomyces heterothallicus CBS 203.75]
MYSAGGPVYSLRSILSLSLSLPASLSVVGSPLHMMNREFSQGSGRSAVSCRVSPVSRGKATRSISHGTAGNTDWANKDGGAGVKGLRGKGKVVKRWCACKVGIAYGRAWGFSWAGYPCICLRYLLSIVQEKDLKSFHIWRRRKGGVCLPSFK